MREAKIVALVIALALGALAGLGGLATGAEGSKLLDPLAIPKYVNQLTAPPPVYDPTVVTDGNGNVRHDYDISMTAFYQQILPAGFPKTWVWGYGGKARDSLTGNLLGFVANSPAPSFEATRGIPAQVTWRNEINEAHQFAVDPTLHWADPNGMGMPMEDEFPDFPPGFEDAQSPVPLVTHLHGGEVPSASDGNPEAWWTYDGKTGPAYHTVYNVGPDAAVFYYPNAQPATTLWYHDHALGITRLNVMSGLAGFYLLRDPADPLADDLPRGKYEMPLVIQDRIFTEDGQMFFPSEGVNPEIHPYWEPEFFGNTIMVNGLVWPNMNVDRGEYRFRLLDGSNARFYTLSFQVKLPGPVMRLPFLQIASDGGYLASAVWLERLTIAPGERAEILVDFSSLPAGTQVLMVNSARSPFPKGDVSDPRTVGQIMQFTVGPEPGPAAALLPAVLNPTFELGYPSLPAPTLNRTLPLFEQMGPGGPLGVFLNGQRWGAEVTEKPTVGATEEWILVNPTVDAHPIHLHLAQFQVISRQSFNARKYVATWMDANGMPPVPDDVTPVEVPVGPYLLGKPMAPPANEQGWKDTIQAFPGEVTVIRVRFAPIDGSEAYPFDVTQGPGYVWHCHILEHEDNEMMRPLIVAAPQE